MKISDAQVQKPLADLIDRQKPFREICLSHDLAFVHVLKCHMRHAAFLYISEQWHLLPILCSEPPTPPRPPTLVAYALRICMKLQRVRGCLLIKAEWPI